LVVAMPRWAHRGLHGANILSGKQVFTDLYYRERY
jgi:hypothetical protein